LQAFMPLQACFSPEAWLEPEEAQPESTAPEPTRPATAANTRTPFFPFT
jgi:hypothetical protein